jgi:Tfp pilus assembly protein PilN
LRGAPEAGHTPPPAVAEIPLETAESWDVRPGEFLHARRSERRSAMLLWRGLLALAACLGLLIVTEAASAGLAAWNRSRNALLASRSADTQAVEDSDNLARRLQQLTSSQLRPFEKLETLGNQLPDSIHFTRLSSTGLDTLVIDAVARNPGDVPIYEGRLQQHPKLASATTRGQQFRDNVTTFALEVVFRTEDPSGEAPAESKSAPAPSAEPAAQDAAQPAAAPAPEQDPVAVPPAGMIEPVQPTMPASVPVVDNATVQVPGTVPTLPPGPPPDFTPPPPPPPPDDGVPPPP